MTTINQINFGSALFKFILLRRPQDHILISKFVQLPLDIACMKVFCSDLLVDVVVNRIVGKYQFSWEVLREDWRSAGWRYLPNLHLVRKTQRVAAVDKAGDAFAEKPSGPIYFDIPSIDIPCTIYWYTIDPKNRFFRFRFFFFFPFFFY